MPAIPDLATWLGGQLLGWWCATRPAKPGGETLPVPEGSLDAERAFNDPVEEVTIRLANLELTIRVREIGATSAGQTGVTASGYELVSSVQTPEPPLESEGPSLPVAVEQSLLEATSARTLTGFHLDF